MVEIVKDFKNELLKRREIEATLVASGAVPSRKEMKELLAEKFDVDKSLVIIKNIASHFGERTVSVSAFIYDDEKTLNTVTLKHILKRNQDNTQEQEEQEA